MCLDLNNSSMAEPGMLQVLTVPVAGWVGVLQHPISPGQWWDLENHGSLLCFHVFAALCSPRMLGFG